MKLNLKRWFLFVILSIFTLSVSGQSTAVYPVELTTFITPPYGTCLKDMVGGERFQVQVLLRDMSKTSENFVIVMSVKTASGTTIFRSNIGHFELTPGRPVYLPTEVGKHIIHNLFRAENIEIGKQYETNCFPEGAYTISFQAFESYRYPAQRIPLSRESVVSLFMQGQSNQPFLVYPYDGDSICSQTLNASVIPFQWQPANPTGESYSYEFQLTKVEENHSAAGSFGSNANVLKKVMYNTMYFHNVNDLSLPLVEGNTYAWRVIMRRGTEVKKDINTGYRTFEYRCTAKPVVPDTYDPKLITEKTIDRKLDPLYMDTVRYDGVKAELEWKEDQAALSKNEYCGVGYEIRKLGSEKWTAFVHTGVSEFSDTLGSLDYNVRYQTRGHYIKCPETIDQDTVYGPYGDTLEFTIPNMKAAKDCGSDLEPLTDCGDTKGRVLKIGDTIYANGSEVIIDSVSYSVSDSAIISGVGHLEMPIIRNIQLKVEFKDIQINCAAELAKGTIKSVYDLKTCAMIDLEEITGLGSSSGARDKQTSSATSKPYSKESFDKSQPGDLFVKDDKTVVMKDDQGNEVEVGKQVSFEPSVYSNSGAIDDGAHAMIFDNTDENTIAFDRDKNKVYRLGNNAYPTFGSDYIIAYLGTNPGKLKKLLVTDTPRTSTTQKYKEVKFLIEMTDGNYLELNYEVKDQDKGIYEVSVPGMDADFSMDVLPIGRMSENDPFRTSGKLKICTYEPKVQKIKFVPVVKDYKVNTEEIQKGLAKTFGRLGLTFDISVDEPLVDEELNSMLSDGLDVTTNSAWTTMSPEMKRIRKIYSETRNPERGTAYLFLVNKINGTADVDHVEGDMPRGKAYGFLSMATSSNNTFSNGRLVAHELGHGLYTLQHTFEAAALKDKSTDNLMDYNNGTFLSHPQWGTINSPTLVWSFTEDDEDAFNPIVQFFVSTSTDLLIQTAAKTTTGVASNIVNGQDVDLVKNFKSAAGDVLTPANIFNTALENLKDQATSGTKNAMQAVQEIVTMYETFDTCSRKGSLGEEAVCLCTKLSAQAIKIAVGEKLKKYVKSVLGNTPTSGATNVRNAKESIVLMFSLFGEKAQKTAKTVLDKYGDSLSESIVDDLLEQLTSYLCEGMANIVREILKPKETPETSPLCFNTFDHKIYKSDDEYNYVEIKIAEDCRDYLPTEDRISSTSWLVSSCVPNNKMNPIVETVVKNVSDEKMDENHFYYVSYKKEHTDPFIGDPTGNNGSTSVNVTIPGRDFYEKIYRIKLKHHSNGDCCPYFLNVMTEKAQSCREMNSCASTPTTTTPAQVLVLQNDVCYESDSKDGYVVNPFGQAYSTKESTEKRRTNEKLNFKNEVPKCSGWTQENGKFTYVSPFVCGGPDRAEKLYKIVDDKAVIQSDVAKNYVHKVFQFWGEDMSDDHLVDKILVYKGGEYKMVELDTYIDEIMKSQFDFLADLYAKVLFLAFSDESKDGPQATMDAIKNAYGKVFEVVPVKDRHNNNNALYADSPIFFHTSLAFTSKRLRYNNKEVFDYSSVYTKDIRSAIKLNYTKDDYRKAFKSCNGFEDMLKDFVKSLEQTAFHYNISKKYYNEAKSGYEVFVKNINILNTVRTKISNNQRSDNPVSDTQLWQELSNDFGIKKFQYESCEKWEEFILKCPELQFYATYDEGSKLYSLITNPNRILRDYSHYNHNGSPNLVFEEGASSFEFVTRSITTDTDARNFFKFTLLAYCYDDLNNCHSVFMNRIQRYVFKLAGYDTQTFAHNGPRSDRYFSINRDDCYPAWWK